MKYTLLFLSLLSFGLTQAALSDSTKLEKKQKRAEKLALNHRYIGLGSGSDFYTTQDQGTSPLFYSGNLGFGELSYISKGDARTFEVSGGASYGLIQGETELAIYSATAISAHGNIDYVRTVPLELGSWKVQVGANNLFTYNNRINPNFFNAAYNYDMLNSLSVAGRIEKRIVYAKGDKTLLHRKKGRSTNMYVDWDMQVNIPVLFVYIRPPFSVIEDFTDNSNPIYPIKPQFGWYGDVWRYNYKTRVTWHLKNKSAIRMSYAFDAYSIDTGINPVNSARHQWYLSFLFKLDTKSATPVSHD